MAKKVEDTSPFHVYVAWVGSSDPPPTFRQGRERPVLPADHPLWPGLPFDTRDGEQLVDTGPNLAALFHPNSPLVGPDRPDRVYLLHDKDDFKSRFVAAFDRIVAARKLDLPAKKWPEYVDLRAAITDPTDPTSGPTHHTRILAALDRWIRRDAPFNPPEKSGKSRPTQITVHLDPGTSAQTMCWVLARWRGLFKDPPTHTVRFLQGDGGPSVAEYESEATRQPVHDFPFDALSRFTWVPDAQPPAVPSPGTLEYKDLKSAAYQTLATEIDKAAMLGIPVLLVGDRGTGKTALARFYHDRRLHYRGLRDGKPVEGKFVPVTLSEFPDVETITQQLFGWKKGSYTGADENFDGSVGAANGGTLFLDEVHHLKPPLQAALLGPLNDGKYRRKGEAIPQESKFSLVVATNLPGWRDKLAEDFRDRIERVVLAVPSFADLQREKGYDDLWQFWAVAFAARCSACGVAAVEPPDECRALLDDVFRHRRLAGNWRDLHRLADHLLMALTHPRCGRPTGLEWDRDGLEQAIDRALPNR